MIPDKYGAAVRGAERIPDGVWLNLPFPTYIGQDAIGSSDLIKLHHWKWGWWWQSRHNPDYRETSTAEQEFGDALHAIVLEGEAAYSSRFACQPARPPNAIDTIDEMKRALREADFKLVRTSGWQKEDWLAAMRDNLPRYPVWSNMLADWRKRTRGDRREVSAEDHRALMTMKAIVTEERSDNADIRLMLAGDGGGFPPLAEVSVLTTMENGMRRRWRIDRMYPRFDVDLKSLGNWSGRPLAWEVGDLIARRGYDIQRADYFEGRREAYRHIAAGRLYGGTPEQRRWISRFPEEFLTWDWVWLFYQKPSTTGRAPVLFPVWDDSWDAPGIPGRLRRYGGAKANKALTFYQECLAEFGLDKPWARVEAVHYTDENMPNAIHLPAFIAESDPIESGAYAGA